MNRAIPDDLVLAALAARADAKGIVSGISREDLAADVDTSSGTVQRAITNLAACGDIEVMQRAYGSNTHVYRVVRAPGTGARADVVTRYVPDRAWSGFGGEQPRVPVSLPRLRFLEDA